MYFKQIKYKTEERVYLEAHPLVRFLSYPLEEIAITDGFNMRTHLVETKTHKSNIIERLKSETNIRNKMFVFYAPNDNDIYWSFPTYDPFNFERVSDPGVRMAEIDVTDSEWKFMMQHKIAKREAEYKKTIETSEKENNKYRFLLIRR